VAFLVDTNVIVYRHDPRFPAKRELATELLREGIAVNQAVLPYQAWVSLMILHPEWCLGFAVWSPPTGLLSRVAGYSPRSAFASTPKPRPLTKSS
jgi:hypothetical protein